MRVSIGLGVAVAAALAGAAVELSCSRGAAAPQRAETAAVAEAGVEAAAETGAGSGADADAGGAGIVGEAAARVAVKVENIGMHIGGGPNDAETKAPIARSVEPHFEELARCFGRVDDPKRGGDFGVDLHIPRDGGRAGVSHPRTSLGPDAFRACVVAVFEAIDFHKPKTGETNVSYSLRFTPAK